MSPLACRQLTLTTRERRNAGFSFLCSMAKQGKLVVCIILGELLQTATDGGIKSLWEGVAILKAQLLDLEPVSSNSAQVSSENSEVSLGGERCHYSSQSAGTDIPNTAAIDRLPVSEQRLLRLWSLMPQRHQSSSR